MVISTADHTHAPAAAMALRLGKHVYCEKPLTHTVFEARTLPGSRPGRRSRPRWGRRSTRPRITGGSSSWSAPGAIGPVKAVHVWLGTTDWSGGERPTQTPPVPGHLDWDLWLGPAPERPYHPTYQPANWRRWWDFGNGTLGDMGCHYVDLPFWALDLRHPTSIEAQGAPAHAETAPGKLVVKYQFPARGTLPPVALTWTQGVGRPEPLADFKRDKWDSGVLFVGEKGRLVADYTKRILLPEDDFEDFEDPEPSIPRSIGHHAEWIAACKDGRPTTCNFDYSGALTEAILLGNVAYRSGQAIEWDGPRLKATNCPQAEAFLRRDYRKGWTL